MAPQNAESQTSKGHVSVHQHMFPDLQVSSSTGGCPESPLPKLVGPQSRQCCVRHGPLPEAESNTSDSRDVFQADGHGTSRLFWGILHIAFARGYPEDQLPLQAPFVRCHGNVGGRHPCFGSLPRESVKGTAAIFGRSHFKTRPLLCFGISSGCPKEMALNILEAQRIQGPKSLERICGVVQTRTTPSRCAYPRRICVTLQVRLC